MPTSLVVLLAAGDLAGAVDLLQEHHAGQVVGQGDGAEREGLVRTGTNLVADAVGAANDKGDVALAAQGKLVKTAREVLARALPALYGKQDNVRAGGNGRKDALPLTGTGPLNAAGPGPGPRQAPPRPDLAIGARRLTYSAQASFQKRSLSFPTATMV